MSGTKKKNGVLMQAGILAAAGIICRIIGLLYRSPLTGIIGDEGNGYYNAAYNIYTIILLVSSYSIPSAISKVIAQRLALHEYRNAQRVFHCALIYVMVAGGIASLFVLFGAGYLTEGYSVMVLRVFAPTILIYGLLGVLRGYFQAHKSMVQTSVSQILEQIFNAAVSMGGAYFLMQMAVHADSSKKAALGAVGSAVGTGIGVLIALLFMWGVYGLNGRLIKSRIEHDRTGQEESWKEIIKTLTLVVMPFILSTCIYNLTTVLDQTIYMKIMIYVKDMEEKSVLTSYGIFGTKAVGISNIPIALSSAMSSALMPAIAASFIQGAHKETRNKVAYSIRATMLISIPAAVGLGVLARPVVLAIYPQRASLELAADLLRWIAPSVVFYALSTLSNSVLQGIGKVNLPVRNAAIALAVQTAALAPLLYFTELGLYGIAVSMTVYAFLMCILNGLSMRKHLEYKQELDKTFARPFVASLIMGAAAFGVYEGCCYAFMQFIESEYLYSLLSLVLAVGVAALLYFVLVIKLRAVREQDLKGLPKGAMLVRAAKKLHLL